MTGETPLIETANASLGTALDSEQMEILPTPGRNAFFLAVTTAGVVAVGDPQWVRQQDQTNSSLLSLGGGPVRGNLYTMDGVAIVDMRNRAVMIPSMTAIEEVKVQVSTYDAEMGRTGGGTFNTIHKTGTNNWAGAALYQVRPTWGRKAFFHEEVKGVEKAEGSYKLYGGAVGGPIFRDKTFFWASTEGYRTFTGRGDALFFPTQAMVSGDFSATGRTIYDPLTYDPATGTRQPFPGNIIPADRIDPVGGNLAALLATVPGGDKCTQGPGGWDCTGNAALNDKADQMSANVSHHFSDAWQLAGTYMYYKSDEPANRYFGSIMGAEEPTWAPGSTSLLRDVNVLALNLTNIPSDTSVLTMRYGFTQFNDSNHSFESDPSDLGWSQRFLDAVENETPRFPNIAVDGYGDADSTHGGWSTTRIKWYSHELSGTWSQFFGAHTVKFGAQYRKIALDAWLPGHEIGSFSFTQGFTEGPNPRSPTGGTGDALASLLLGLPADGYTMLARRSSVFIDYFGGYVQDDWRVSSELVVNMGLRIEHEKGLQEADNGLTVGFDRDSVWAPGWQPTGMVPAGAPGFPLRGGLMYAGVGGNPTEQSNNKSIKLSPRIGFAYTINPETVLRGGFGVFWAPRQYPGPSSTSIGLIGFSGRTGYVDSLDGGLTPVSGGSGSEGSLSDPFPGGLQQPVGNVNGLQQNVGDTVYFNDQFRDSPYMMQYSVELQKELPGAVAVSLGYLGSRGENLAIGGTNTGQRNLNQLDPRFASLGGDLDERLPNPFFGQDQFGGISASETLPRSQLLRPYPQFYNVYMQESSATYSRYNSIRAEIQKRFRGSWGARVNYTYIDHKDNSYETNAFLTDETSQVFNTYNIDADFGPSVFSTPHRFNITGMYRLPSPAGGAANAIAGGWTISAVASFHRGFPLFIRTNTNNTGMFTFYQRPNNTGVDPNVSGSVEDKYLNYINPAAYEQPAAYTLGTTAKTDGRIRTAFRKNLDMSFEKTTPIGGTNLQIRIEFINMMNWVDWRGPRARWGRSNFGQITGTRAFPFTTQIMIRLRF